VNEERPAHTCADRPHLPCEACDYPLDFAAEERRYALEHRQMAASVQWLLVVMISLGVIVWAVAKFAR
jgi:hypothetical protein